MSGPCFHAWCEEAGRVEAFAAALSALVYPHARCHVELHTIGAGKIVGHCDVHPKDIIDLVRTNFTTKSHVRATIPVHVRVEVGIAMSFECFGEGYFTPRYDPYNALVADIPEAGDVYGEIVDFVLYRGERSPTGEAAIMGMRAQTDIEDVFVRICMPDESKRITTGCISTSNWYAPIELAGTYNADGNVARDVALSWLYLHDGDRVEHAARASLDTLAARVDAAPKGTRIGVSTDVKRRIEHTRRDIEMASSKLGRPPHRDAIRRGARAILPTDVELTREQVLKVLDAPLATLVEALEAAAVPDDEWRAAEAIALEMIEAKTRGEQTVEVNVTKGHVVQFLQHHAPYHVRRLPNGGVLLATHPYRTLWPLWADALLLLGIRTDK